MILPRYEKYKDSGLPWVGRMPSHWLVTKTKYICEFSTGWTPPTGDSSAYEGENLWATISDLGARVVYETAKKISGKAARQAGIDLIPPGSLMFSFKLSIGQVSFAGNAMYTNEAIATFRESAHLSLAFAYYAFPLFLVQNAAENIYGAKLLNQELIRGAVFALPPVQEQFAIARFLDRETAKIDALIAEQEKLIALLVEKRQATMSYAVTKGLLPNAPMKDSGVAWLGEVPAHWGISALSYLATIETGSTPDRGEPSYWNGNIPWLKTGEINWAPIREAEEFITQAGFENSAVKVAKPGTLLMAMYGQGITRGRVALLEIEATYNQACAAIQFGRRIISQFGRYFFMAAYHHVRDAGNETSQMNLSAGLIAKIRLPVPPEDEQKLIVAFLDSEIMKVDFLMAESERAILLLKERRVALITAVVTGQVDVRSAVSIALTKLPQDIAA